MLNAPRFDDQQRKRMRKIAEKDDDVWIMSFSEMDDEVASNMILSMSRSDHFHLLAPSWLAPSWS